LLKLKYLIATILILLLFPSLAWAVQWEARNDVASDRVWHVLFSQPVDTQSINNSIYINDSQGDTVSSFLTPSADGKTIAVDAVPDYQPGQQYYLYISDLIKSAQQNPIKEPIILPFTIAQSSVNATVAAPVLSSPEVTTKGDVSLTFNKDMADPTGIGAEGQFTVLVDSLNVAVTSVVCTNTTTKIKLVLVTKVTGGQTVTVAYTKSANENKQIRSTDGGVLESFTAQAVSN